MPTYEYVCVKCQGTFELVQSITEAPLEVCPKDKCQKARWGKGAVKRMISGGAGLLFKGTGFYITDYRSDSYKEAAKREAGTGSGKSEAKTEGKAEAKSDSKGESKTEKTPTPAKSSKSEKSAS